MASAQQIRVWDLDLQFLRLIIPAENTERLAFNRDGSVLAIVDETGQLSNWSTTFPALTSEIEAWWNSLNVERTTELETIRPAAETYHSERATSADGRLALVTASRNSLNLEDAVTHEHFIEYPVESIDAVAIAPDGRWAATAAVARSEKRPGVQFWNLRSGRQIGPTTPQTDSVLSLNFSADSRCLAAGGNGTMTVWEVATQSVKHEIATEANHHQWVLFTPDNRRLVSADPRQIRNRIYSIRSGELLWEIRMGPARWAFISPEIISDRRFGTWRPLKPQTVPTRSQP